MKRALICVLSVFLLLAAACSEQPQESRLMDGSVEFTKENYPTVCVTPYTENYSINMTAAVLGITAEEAKALIDVCDSTDECYLKLASGECDIVFAHDYGKSVTEKLNTTALEFTSAELQRDALVFMTNGRAGVSELTTEQLTSIYKGEITNWNEVGGSDMPITLFGLKGGTAGQNAFEKYISPDIAVAPVYKTVVTADGEFRAEIDYDNSDGAIGYTLVSLVGGEENGGIKLISINKAAPSSENITSGNYPFSVSVNLTIRASEAAENNVRILYDWILSEQGKIALGLVVQ